MKIAVPTRDGVIDDHFGHCAYYTIFEIENNEIVATSRLESPQGCGCKSGIAADMESMGISVMLAGNMGVGAKNKLESHNIKVVRGCRGNIEMVVRAYLIGLIKDSGEGCSHHECHSHE
jgi:predicted Fe-Mo cluster-binding NifX family protein